MFGIGNLSSNMKLYYIYGWIRRSASAFLFVNLIPKPTEIKIQRNNLYHFDTEHHYTITVTQIKAIN